MAKKMKVCTKCGQLKPLSGFSKDKAKKDGLKTQCKECMHEANAEWRADRRERKDVAKRLQAVGIFPPKAKEETANRKACKGERKDERKGERKGSGSAKPCKCDNTIFLSGKKHEKMKATVLFAKIVEAVYDLISEQFGLGEADIQVIVKSKTAIPKTKKK